MKRQTLIAAVAVLLAGTTHAAVTELILFKQPDFKGPSHVVKGEVNTLENSFANEAESLIVRGGYWVACTEGRFKGRCRVYDPGQYARLGDFSRNIVSVRFLGTDYAAAKREADRIAANEAREARIASNEPRFAPGEPYPDRGRHRRGALELYGREGFNGRSLRVEENVRDLWERRFDGRASSLMVERGTWELCTQANFEGRCRTFGPGEYPRLAGLDNRVSSIRQVN